MRRLLSTTSGPVAAEGGVLAAKRREGEAEERERLLSEIRSRQARADASVESRVAVFDKRSDCCQSDAPLSSPARLWSLGALRLVPADPA